MRLHLYFALILGLVIFSGTVVLAQQTLITREQNAWLDKNNRTILVHPQEVDPPFIFVGSGSQKEVKGFSVDYIQAIAKKLNITIKFSEAQPLNRILASARERDDNGVILSLSPSSEREQYLYFTDSYYSTPAVIAVRKDFSSKKSVITLADFSKKKVAVGDKYAVQSFIQVNYPDVSLVSVSDDQGGLQKLLLGDVDAVVMDLASLTYYTANDVLSYVKIVGRTGFEYKHSIGVPKSSPELVLILNQGLKSISDSERQVLINKWMGVSVDDLEAAILARDSKEANTNTTTPWLIFIGFIVLIAATIIIVLLLQRRNYTTPRFLRRRAVLSDVRDEFQELKIAQEELKEDLAQIAELEKDIEDKMGSVKR